MVDNVIRQWFITEWSVADHGRHSLKEGDSGNMSFWEALTLLCAVRLWLPAAPLAGQVRVKSDSLAALRLAVKLASPSAVQHGGDVAWGALAVRALDAITDS